MKKYKDLDKNSEIEAYEYDEHGMVVRFKKGEEIEYSSKTVEFFDLDCLRNRADSGRGLDEYIKEIEARRI